MTDQELMQQTNTFLSPPKPNLKISFGGGSKMFIQFFSAQKPSRMQRWFLRKLLGIYIEEI